VPCVYGVAVPEPVSVRYTKWDDRLHWHFDLERLGVDGHGTWLAGRRGIIKQRGDEPPKRERHGFVMLVPWEGRWTAYWSVDDEIELYVDVTTTPVWTPGGITAVDLDLDVVRWRGGGVEVLDEDEFDEHRAALAYPAPVVEEARATTAWLVDAITSRAEPFGAVGLTWLSQLTV
jgi:uncharacterized protein